MEASIETETNKDLQEKLKYNDPCSKSNSKGDNNAIIICNKCELIPDNYISLNCQHNFCLPCLAQIFFKIIESQNFQYENQAVIINCPVCGKQTELDKLSMDALEEAILVLGGLGQDINIKQGRQQQKFDPILEDSKEQIPTEENQQTKGSSPKNKNQQQSRKHSNNSQQFQQDILDELQNKEFDLNADTQSEPNLKDKQQKIMNNNKRMNAPHKQFERQNQQLNQYNLKNIKETGNEHQKQMKVYLDDQELNKNNNLNFQKPQKQSEQLEKCTQKPIELENAQYKCPEHPTESVNYNLIYSLCLEFIVLLHMQCFQFLYRMFNERMSQRSFSPEY